MADVSGSSQVPGVYYEMGRAEVTGRFFISLPFFSLPSEESRREERIFGRSPIWRAIEADLKLECKIVARRVTV